MTNHPRSHGAKDCESCGQPMKPKGVRKKPFEYDHAQGCPMAKRIKRTRSTDSAAHGISTKKASEIRKALRSAAKLAENPYSDAVAAFGSDEPLAVGRKIAKAIRRLLK